MLLHRVAAIERSSLLHYATIILMLTGVFFVTGKVVRTPHSYHYDYD